MESNHLNASEYFGNVTEGEIILVTVPENQYAESNAQILKYHTNNKKYRVVYLTVNKPFSTLVDLFKKDGIDLSKVFIIDAVTPVPAITRTGAGVFVGSPKELTNISITTTSVLSNMDDTKVLFLDSVTTLLIYNSVENVTEFIHFISNKMRALKITFAIMCISDLTEEKTVKQLSQFCDKLIQLGE
jgi:archaellum biogenesis ATPase FlaH